MPTIQRIQNVAAQRRSFRLSLRLVIGLGVAGLLLFSGWLIYRTYGAVRESNTTHERLVATANETVLLEDVRAAYLNEWLVISSARAGTNETFVSRFYQARNSIDSAFDKLKVNASLMGPDEVARIESLEAQHQQLAQSWTPVIAMIVEGRGAEAMAAINGGLLAASNSFVDQLADHISQGRTNLNTVLETSEASRTRWEQAAAMVVVAMGCMLLMAGYATQRWLLGPLDSVARAARLIADGETSATAPVRGPSEIANLAGDVNLMAASLLHRSKELSDYLAKDLEARTAALEAANQALTASEEKLNRVIESAPLILFAIDAQGVCTLSRGRGLAGLGLAQGGANGINFFELEGRQAALVDVMRRAVAGEELTREVQVNRVTLELHCAPSRDEQGHITGAIGVAMDISESYKAREALQASEARYRELFENANDIIYTHDLNGSFTSVNSAGQKVTGYSDAELRSMNIRDILAPEFLAQSLEALRQKREGEVEKTTYEVEIISKDGRRIPLEVSTRVMYNAAGTPVAVQGMARDVSDRRQAEENRQRHTRQLESLYEQLSTTHAELAESQRALQLKSEQLERALADERARARIDPLTGALNHGGIVEVLNEAVLGAGEGGSFAVFMVDIDDMKAANDVYGHTFGDRVLRHVQQAMARDGAIVGRYGGDEFIAVLPGGGPAEADAYRRAVIEAVVSAGLKDPEGVNDVPIEISLGYAIYPRDGRRIEELIAAADEAMYSRRRAQRSSASASRRMGDKAVRVLGEIVPVLTGPGDHKERLNFVCERLALECGYAGVELMINPWRAEDREIVVAYPPIPPELEAAWMKAREEYYTGSHPLPVLLENARRPVIIENAAEDPRLVGLQREVLKSVNLKSLMIAPLAWEGELIGSMTVASRQAGAFGPAEGQMLMGIASQVASIVTMTALVDHFDRDVERLSAAFGECVRLLASTIEAQAGVLSHDMDRLASVASALAGRLGFSAQDSRDIGVATMLHDVGKYRVPPEILAQPHDLSADEYEIVKSHTLWGGRLLSDIPGFQLASQVARWHHERWDGRGYPDGLVGDEIPLPVAIAAVADSLDAMIYDRVYRDGMSPEDALELVISGAGSHFNPRVVQALVQLWESGEISLDGNNAADWKAA
jgi:PAS domain S-box-containing protein/diguanylate cyclase (GGDEF)-like protein